MWFSWRKENEKKLHIYFTNISKSIGFDDTEAISLFDVPGIFGSHNSYDLWMPQVFLFSICKDYNETFDSVSDYYNDMDEHTGDPLPISTKTAQYSNICTQKWLRHLNNFSGISNF